MANSGTTSSSLATLILGQRWPGYRPFEVSLLLDVVVVSPVVVLSAVVVSAVVVSAVVVAVVVVVVVVPPCGS